jgi:type VII secretion protein EccE
MATAARSDARASGRPAADPGQGGRHPGVSADPGFQPRPGRIGSLPLVRLILLEAAAAFAATPFLLHKPMAIAGTGPAALLCVIGAAGGTRGRWIGATRLVHADFKERQEQRRPASGDSALAPLRETFPALRTATVATRGGEPVGVIGDGTFLTAVIQLDSRGEPLREQRQAHPLPVGAVAAALADDQVPVASVQLITHTRPAPAPHLPRQSLSARSYQSIGGNVPAQRTTWAAVRLDPEQAQGAVQARGGGTVGAQRALLTAVQRVASQIEGAGFEATILSEPELISALGTACNVMQTAVNPAAAAHRRTEETRRHWRCDNSWHATYWLDKPPTFTDRTSPDFFAAVGALPALSTSVAVNLARGNGGSVAFSCFVRITAGSETQLTESGKVLEQRAGQAGAGLTRLDGEQLPGLVATVPLGGE